MDLPKEPVPQPIPQPTGAVPAGMQKWIGVIILGCIMAFAVIGWAISRWSGPSSFMGQRQEKKHAESKSDTGQKSTYQINEDLEKAYEKGRSEGSKSILDRLNSNLNPPSIQSSGQATGQTSQGEKLTPKQEYEKLLHDAAMTDNMVEGKKQNNDDARRPNHNPAPDSGSDLSVQRMADVERFLPGSQPNLQGVNNDWRNTADGSLPHASVGAIPRPQIQDRANHIQAAERSVRSLPPNALPEGTDIACTLVNQLNGDNTGPMKVQVSNDIPFPRTEEVAIPQGSLFLGEAQKVGGQFQERLAVSFHRLQIGQTAGQIRQINLKAPALDPDGSTALADQVNRHYFGIFGASLLIGAIGGLAQIGNGSYGGYGGIDSGSQVRNGISQSMAQSSAQILNRFLNRPPTITIRPGHPVIVHLTENLEIPN